jgi:hypothetical protein
MFNNQKLFLIYLFQIIPLLIYPPETLKSGVVFVGIMVIIFALLGYGLWRGRTWALSLSLTLQGFNVIVRLMMLFPNALMEALSLTSPTSRLASHQSPCHFFSCFA